RGRYRVVPGDRRGGAGGGRDTGTRAEAAVEVCGGAMTLPGKTVANPLARGVPQALLPQPCALVIFGAAGDLSWRKLLPAVYNLNVDGVLPSNFAVVGFGLGAEGDPDEWIRQRARDGTARFTRRPPDDNPCKHFVRSTY